MLTSSLEHSGDTNIVDSSQMPTESEGLDESDSSRDKMHQQNQNKSDADARSALASDGTRSKRKHVVQNVTKRQLPYRSARISSYNALESGTGALEVPHLGFSKEGYSTVQPSSGSVQQIPHLEPAEMIQCNVAEYDDLVAASTSSSCADSGGVLNRMISIEHVNNGRHILAHQLGDSVWPLLSQEAVDFAYAANVIVGLCQVPPEQICQSTPQKFTNTGTFVVDLSTFGNRHEVTLDGLGIWGRPQGSSRFYKLVGSMPVRVWTISGSDVKVLCNRYEHPGTRSECGRFIRKIVTGWSTTTGSPLPLAVIVYVWLGEPHSIQIRTADNGDVRASTRPYGSRSWEVRNVDISRDEGLEFDGQPLYAKMAIDFDTVARIILGIELVQPNRICNRIPQKYRSQGTFVIDLVKVGGDAELRKDGLDNWSKPSGCSKYYKLNANNEVVRTEKGASSHGNEKTTCDIQILAKRYENNSATCGGAFVRKIYTGKAKVAGAGSETQQLYSIAVITYFWKGTMNVDECVSSRVNHGKRTYEEAVIEDGISVNSSVGVIEEATGVQPSRKISYNDDGSKPKHPSANSASTSTIRNENEMDTTQRRVPRPSGRTGSGWQNEATPSFDNLVLNHTDHLKRLALAKELENQNRLAALLDRAEQFLDRFEQAGLNMGLLSCDQEPQQSQHQQQQYVFESSEAWEAQPMGSAANSVTIGGDERVPDDSNTAEGYVVNETDRIDDERTLHGDFMQVQYQ
ncbi:unnamed protein product [Anisakis simplex]|uniref:SET domain-containing protein n=1 Tax=Anisakis simplex TaxID=6269 RepID=A0A0M3JVJ5_ANISI|nr:unnamed protein product [Anisakis simplex]